MSKKLYISWKGGPSTVREEFDMLCSQFAKSTFTAKDLQHMDKISMRRYIDFIPEDCFLTSNVFSCEGKNAVEKIDYIFDFVLKQKYPIDVDFIACCKGIKELELCMIVQAMLIEIVYHNHNVAILLSEESTQHFYDIVSDYFNISCIKMPCTMIKILKRMCKEGNGCWCVSDYNATDDRIEIYLSPSQSLCRHSI